MGLRLRASSRGRGRFFPGDEFELGSEWLFVDLWRRLGIRYPDDLGASSEVIRFGELLANRMGSEPER